MINHPANRQAALDYFTQIPGAAILVHGGGRKASEVLAAMGIAPKMINGRRITDAASLEVVTMVYAGLLNKQLVADLQKAGCSAIGFSGADADVIRASKRPVREIDYGFAGDIQSINAPLLAQVLELNLRPVLCPITHNGSGQLLNTNADTIANETAQAMAHIGHAVSLRYCFELPGVLEDIHRPESVISQITSADYTELKARGIIADGMIPKLDNAFAALQAGVKEVVIGNINTMSAAKATRLI